MSLVFSREFQDWHLQSKHLKGQLDPPVGNGHVFWTKGGQLDPPVSDVTFFGPKEISWTGGTVP